jgi:hypothetical protein
MVTMTNPEIPSVETNFDYAATEQRQRELLGLSK